MIPDHVPELGYRPGTQRPDNGGQFQPSAGLAYGIGYMNATLKAALSNKRRTQA